MFEVHYSFDIESLRKENLGKAIAQLNKYNGITPFVVAYTTQVSLGGHSIAIDKATAALLLMLDLISEADAHAFQAPGLERAIPKNKGPEFFSVVHQLAATLFAAPHHPEIRKIIVEIDPLAKNRLPKRGGRVPRPAAEDEAKKAAKAEKSLDKSKPRKPDLPAPKKKPAASKSPAKRTAAGKKPAGKSKATKLSSSPTRQLARKKPR
jgi:hypothetical protein